MESGFAPLNPQQVYRVVTNDYMRTGGDEYTVFRDFAIHPYDYGPPMDEALEDYIQELGTINNENLQTGRIVDASTQKPESPQPAVDYVNNNVIVVFLIIGVGLVILGFYLLYRNTYQ